MIPVITIQGATASGKSALALELANWLNTEIVSVDSRQVYRYMDIGTAKPSHEEMAMIRHHLIDIINPDERYNAGRFIQDIKPILQDLHHKGKIPVLCGGTGLYFKSLKEGIFNMPEVPDCMRIRLNNELEEKGLAFFYDRLKEIDPKSAERISCQDKQRVLRAWEVFEITGKTLTENWAEQNRNHQNYLFFDIITECERPVLYQRINDRFDQMIDKGLLNEIRNLLEKGYHEACPGLNTVGYKEFIPYLREQENYQNCLVLAKQHSRNYAKRQDTWNRNIKFNVAFKQSLINISEIKSLLEIWLKEVIG